MKKTAQMILDKIFSPKNDVEEEVVQQEDQSYTIEDAPKDGEDIEEEDIDMDLDDSFLSISLPEDVEIKEVEELAPTKTEKEYIFKLAPVPGAEDLEEEIEEEPVVEIDEKTNTPKDEWDWETGGVKNFLSWLETMFKSIPKHSGKDTTGVERALAFFKKLDTEISRAMSKDYKREIDAAKAEQARDEIKNGMKRLVERLDKLNKRKYNTKKAENNQELVKNAETSNIGRQQIAVPFLISSLARTCIEAAVQGGKDIEDVYQKMVKDFGLDKRDRFQLIQLIKDMGYPFLLDRVNFEEDIKPSDPSKPSEFITQYYA